MYTYLELLREHAAWCPLLKAEGHEMHSRAVTHTHTRTHTHAFWGSYTL